MNRERFFLPGKGYLEPAAIGLPKVGKPRQILRQGSTEVCTQRVWRQSAVLYGRCGANDHKMGTRGAPNEALRKHDGEVLTYGSLGAKGK